MLFFNKSQKIIKRKRSEGQRIAREYRKSLDLFISQTTTYAKSHPLQIGCVLALGIFTTQRLNKKSLIPLARNLSFLAKPVMEAIQAQSEKPANNNKTDSPFSPDSDTIK